MDKLLIILGASLGSIALGYVLQRILLSAGRVERGWLLGASKYMKMAAFFVLQPFAIIGTFWRMSLANVEMILFPILGLVSVLFGGAVALGFIKVLDFPPKKAASVFVSGMFTNCLTFGGLTGYVLFADTGYSLAQLFTMFISASYYLIGYPVSNNLAKGLPRVLRLDLRILRRNPLLFVPPAAIVTGLILNASGALRPLWMDPIIGVLVPCISVLLGMSIGISLRFSKVRDYTREISVVMAIKFLITPAFMIPLGLLLGLQNVGDGIPFKMLVVLSVMPVAFNALVPPSIFGFDLDLANSAWVVTTASLIVIVPVLYFTLL